MKPLYKIILGILFLPLVSCQDVLDKHDLTKLDDRIWDDALQVELYLNNLYYNNMPGASFGNNAPFTEESYSSTENFVRLLYGFATPSEIDEVTVFHKDNYGKIRRINIGLEGIENSSIPDTIKGILSGQAIFLRVYRYWEMVRLYGGVPIIKEVQDPYDGPEALDVPRPKTGDAINDLVVDLDYAIEKLPLEWKVDKDKGRITSGAAAAFKGRILLTWASPMFNPNNFQERWQQAYDANKQAIDLLSKMTTPRSLVADFRSIFTMNVLENPEAIIFRRYSLSAGSEYTHNWEQSIRPFSGGGNASNAPTWELVQAFPMANGKLINEPGSGYDEVLFWKDRDPRFYATIAYNGMEWPMNGRDRLPVWCFRNVVEGNRVPATGFYNKKASNPTININDVSQTSTAWLELRYAEVLLNLAECANELALKDEAIEIVRAIRARAGIEAGNGDYGIPGSASKEKLRELIMIERQVEFAFENQRYWDLRRRKMYREDLGEYTKKLNGTQRHKIDYKAKGSYGRPITAEGTYKGWLPIDTAYNNGSIDMNDVNSFGKYFSSSILQLERFNSEEQVIDYKELYDFFAVPSSMINKSTAVKQTKGWVNGTYDPLEE